jgi:truncated hemoglobin YjbI
MANVSQNPITRIYGPKTTKSSDTLYERMGGEAKLDQVVTDVYNDMLKDKEIGKQFARFRLERLKDRTVDYLRGEWGGEEYKGSDLWISHSHMGINNHWYDIMMKYYVQRIRKARIGKKEAQEMLDSLEKMRKPIVDPGLKLKDMYLKYQAKEAAKAGGDGWGEVSNDPKERAKKEAATLAMLAGGQREQTMQKLEPKKEQPAEANAKSKPKPKPKEEPREEPKEEPKQEVKQPVQQSTDKATKAVIDLLQNQLVSVAEEQAAKQSKSEESGGSGEASTAASATHAFDFAADLDAPPCQVPSSKPSGSELLYRMSGGGL